MFTDQQVAAYHEATLPQIDELKSFIETPFFDGTKSLLDVGCGDGKLAAHLAKRFPSITVIACDVSASMIAFASKRFPPQHYPNLHFIQKDACHLDFQEKFDRVISFNCLHWIKKQKNALRQIHASLKPGGKAFLVVAQKSSEDDLQKVCRNLILSSKWIFSFITFRHTHSFHTKKEYTQILQKEHFIVDQIQEKKRFFFLKR